MPIVGNAESGAFTPEQAARRRRMIEALMTPSDKPIEHWLQGAAEIAKSVVGGIRERRLEHDEHAARADAAKRFHSILEDFGGSSLGDVLDLMSNPWLSSGQQRSLGTLLNGTFPGVLGGRGHEPQSGGGRRPGAALPAGALPPNAAVGSVTSVGPKGTWPSAKAAFAVQPRKVPMGAAGPPRSATLGVSGVGPKLVNQAKSALLKGAPPLKILDRLRKFGVKI